MDHTVESFWSTQIHMAKERKCCYWAIKHGFTEVWTVEIGSDELRFGQIRHAQVGEEQVGLAEIGLTQICAVQSGSRQVGLS